MATRRFKEQSEKFIARMKAFGEGRIRPLEEPRQFNRSVDSLLNNIHQYAQRREANLDRLLNPQDAEQNLDWVRTYGTVKQNYAALHNAYQRLCDEEAAIYRIERKSHLVALLFRFLTTLSIGFGVLIVYWIAGEFNIQMPLLRIV